MKVKLFAAGAMIAGLAATHAGAAALNPGTGVPFTLTSATYTQDFNSLAPTGSSNTALPSGWQFYEGGPSGDGYYVGGVSSSSGGIHAYGSGTQTERALGALPSSGYTPVYFGAIFQNGLGGTINSLDIAYTGEQWWDAFYRSKLTFEYSLDASNVNDGTWTAVSALDFLAPNTGFSSNFGGQAIDGNAAGNRSAISGLITGLSIGAGQTFAVRWTAVDLGAYGEDGLAVDDFRLTANLAATAPVPEPESWAMMIGGLGLAGAAMRRRKAGPAAAFA